MPRTKGAKNKEKTDEYLAQLLEKRGYKVTRGATETLKAIKDIAEKPVKKARAKLTIDKPKPRENEKENDPPVNLNGTVIRCGNPACNKILEKEFSKCPFCGVKLTWD